MDWNRLFAYDEWANREEVAKLQSMASPPDKALKTLGHIIGAEAVWIARLTGSEPKVSVWPDLTIQQIIAELDRLHEAWSAYLANAKTDGELRYVNTKGETFTNRVDDVLMHVIIHGGYHRGQIATLVRAVGEVPAYTDYIHCVRHGFV